jgi:ATP-dependent Lon protease
MPLAADVDRLLRDVVRLSAKLTSQDIEIPDNIPDVPIELS